MLAPVLTIVYATTLDLMGQCASGVARVTFGTGSRGYGEGLPMLRAAGPLRQFGGGPFREGIIGGAFPDIDKSALHVRSKIAVWKFAFGQSLRT